MLKRKRTKLVIDRETLCWLQEGNYAKVAARGTALHCNTEAANCTEVLACYPTRQSQCCY